MAASAFRASPASGAVGLFFTTSSSTARAFCFSPFFSNANPR